MGQLGKKAHFISGMLIFGTCTSILMKVKKDDIHHTQFPFYFPFPF